MSDNCGCGSSDSGDGETAASPRPAKGEELANNDRQNPFADGVDRRRLLQASGTVGATAALAGCSGGG
ncbi:hypothetical protein DJ72_14195, partial [Halorubrum distributum]